jgi:hypothetical protein
VGEPLLGADSDEAIALAARVVLVDDRAPPLEHAVLHVDGAGRSGVDRHPQAAVVEGGALVLGELKHPDEHRRHELSVRHAMAFDGREGGGRVEALHDHDRAAPALDTHRPAERSGVVEGCRAEVDGIRANPIEGAEQLVQSGRCPERPTPQGVDDSLGPPGGT